MGRNRDYFLTNEDGEGYAEFRESQRDFEAEADDRADADADYWFNL